MKISELLRRVSKARAFSPEAFFIRAVLLSVLYLISRSVGLQEYTTFLSGTAANPNMSWHTSATLGLVHILLYFGFIALAPIFLMTAVLLYAWHHWHPQETVPIQKEGKHHALP
jgi:hypothetical protein